MKHLILDIGNVVSNVNLDVFANKMTERLSISHEKAWTFLRKIQKTQDLGHTTVREALKDESGVENTETMNVLIAAWLDTIHLNHEVIREIESITSSLNIKVAILSNMGMEHKNHIESQGFFKDAIKYYSCDIGVRKPSEIYYWSFLQRYPEFNGATYFDDMPDNINTGNKMGLNSVMFDISDCSIGKMNDRIKQEINKHLTR
jgi:FMN phosphatase YigB (HAD superfamily)